MKIFFILLFVINSIEARSLMPKSLVVVDCEPRSRLSISISPDPMVFRQKFEITIKAWASLNYQKLWGKLDIWGGNAPGNTTRLLSLHSSLCGKHGFSCTGRLGDYLFFKRNYLNKLPFPGFYNISMSIYSKNGRRLVCGRLQLPVIEKP
uniref:uncharacterized protein LOC113474414 n=1 Tax=Ciona intestinalis TaxID=7719 RepID=UPI000EF486CD|nr:uncharacterized protein LOC113474414 [Ciona intestinalis]|eukprot:XP_026691191.1 uncharacterized protein LOC113474414 [Ciona intestinalis]